MFKCSLIFRCTTCRPGRNSIWSERIRAGGLCYLFEEPKTGGQITLKWLGVWAPRMRSSAHLDCLCLTWPLIKCVCLLLITLSSLISGCLHFIHTDVNECEHCTLSHTIWKYTHKQLALALTLAHDFRTPRDIFLYCINCDQCDTGGLQHWAAGWGRVGKCYKYRQKYLLSIAMKEIKIRSFMARPLLA